MPPSAIRRILDPWWLALGVSLGVSALASCRIERGREDGGSRVHPVGYAEPASASFHGGQLAATGYPLEDCRACHGDDYNGAFAAPSCTTSLCHQEGVEACGTCHGVGTEPDPGTDGHPAHHDCATCHPTRHDARELTHPDGLVDIAFTGLASSGGATPVFDPGTRVCSDVYCHGGRDFAWTDTPGELACDACHDAQPAWHGGFNDGSPESCASCHDPGLHLDGGVDTAELGCDGCHGTGEFGAPPPDLDGATDPQSPGVGAHRRHLDPDLPDRIGSVARCDQCHVVPDSLEASGHLDPGGVAEVLVWNGSYDPDAGRCVTTCHFNKDPGPLWTDDSGAELACGACHEAAPTQGLDGSPHPVTTPGSCGSCHTFDPETHVDGKVDLLP